MSVVEAVEFRAFPKIARLNRTIVVTEKLDGTNAAVGVTEGGHVYAQSRKRIIVPGADNFGFAQWVTENEEDLLLLGPGLHFGEWWGKGIQRGYGLEERRFSLFNTARWGLADERPECCHVVPTILIGDFTTTVVEHAVLNLRMFGSAAATGFMKPEGIVIHHSHSNGLFKVTLENDEKPKGLMTS